MEAVATRVASPEFIGRRRELGSLTDAVVRGTAGDAVVALVGGDAGMGKSRLVAEVADTARERGWLVLEGGCVSLGNGEGLPFAPIVEALRRLPAMIAAGQAGTILDIDELRMLETSDLGRLLPELGAVAAPDPDVFDRPGWVQARIFEGLLVLLRSLGERIPVLLVVEDLHWADSSTRDVLSFLARNARTERLAVIGTYRTDELNRRHPLRPWLSEMDRLPQGRPDRDRPVRPLRARRADRRDPRPSPEPRDARGDRAPRRGQSVLRRGAAGVGCRRLRRPSAADASRRPDDARDSAVRGRPADPRGRRCGRADGRAGPVRRVAGAAETDIEGPLREAVAAQILTIDPQNRPDAYRFRHALLAEAVYDDLLPSERRRLHAAYAAALDARPVAARRGGRQPPRVARSPRDGRP